MHGGRGARVKLHGQRAVLRHAADGEDVAVLLYNGGIRRGKGVAAHAVALSREGRDGVAADGDRAARLVGRDGRERERSGIAAVLAGIARGRVIICGELAAEQQPGKLRIVDEDVAVALHLLDAVVAAHLPGVHGVLLHPFEQGVEALDDGHAGVLAVVAVKGGQAAGGDRFKQVRLAPAAVDIQQHARQVALDVVGDLDAVVLRAVPQDGLAVEGLRAAVGIDAQHVAHGVVAAGGIHAGILRAQVVQVAAAALLHEARAALRPDVLTAHAAAGRVAVEQEQAVLAL